MQPVGRTTRTRANVGDNVADESTVRQVHCISRISSSSSFFNFWRSPLLEFRLARRAMPRLLLIDDASFFWLIDGSFRGERAMIFSHDLIEPSGETSIAMGATNNASGDELQLFDTMVDAGEAKHLEER